ncbi:MAG: hypothetical protein RW306_16245 [Geobacteraceae bacterium]|nr:hypothetical protein [Geobacteraceae bacterium]
MATYQELHQAVMDLLSNPVAPAVLQLNSPTRERAFEAYIFSLVVKAVREAGGTVQLMGIQSGLNPDPVVFRGGPGQMSSTSQNFVYAHCTLNNKRFEVHVDVQYQGASGATHEIDVSIYDADRANAVRASGAVPGIRYLSGAIECKFYDSSLGTGLGRAFVGLVADCGALTISSFVTNGQNDGLARYFTQKSRPQPFFGLSPLRPATVTRFVAAVEQALRKALGVI